MQIEAYNFRRLKEWLIKRNVKQTESLEYLLFPENQMYLISISECVDTVYNMSSYTLSKP